MTASVQRQRALALGSGALLALAAAVAAPSSTLLPAPAGAAEVLIGAAVLAAVFAAGLMAPHPALYGLVALAVLEGGVRKWIANDVTVFMLKDFLALGIYAGVLPRLSWREWRRTPWVVIPLAGLLLLAVLHAPRSESVAEAAVGLRAYAIYVPLLWVGPKLLDRPRRVDALLLLVLVLGVAESLLATAQALTGNPWLNQTVPGALPLVAVSGDTVWARPTGTMLQTGTLAAFFLFPVLVALALVMRHRRGPYLGAGLVSLAILSWGMLYMGSRALYGTVAVAAAALLVYLLWNRRFRALAAVPVALAAGYLLIARQPLVGSGTPHMETYRFADDAGGVHVVTYTLGRAGRLPASDVLDVVAGDAAADPFANGPVERFLDEIAIVADQGLVGHGTGRMTLGSQYLQPVSRDQAAESEYVKVAYELGLPALVLFVVLLASLWAAAAWASFVALEWRRPAAVVALGAATLVPLLSALTYAFDYPTVSISYYLFTGCALAWAGRQSVRAPTPTAAADRRADESSAPSRARS